MPDLLRIGAVMLTTGSIFLIVWGGITLMTPLLVKEVCDLKHQQGQGPEPGIRVESLRYKALVGITKMIQLTLQMLLWICGLTPIFLAVAKYRKWQHSWVENVRIALYATPPPKIPKVERRFAVERQIAE